jgi:DNA-binding MurR/RpiR family transcriptional regulator
MLFLTYTPKLTHAELEVYRYLSTNIEKSVFMTIQELADETHLSKSAIWRFCKKFECTGYTDFRFKLK